MKKYRLLLYIFFIFIYNKSLFANEFYNVINYDSNILIYNNQNWQQISDTLNIGSIITVPNNSKLLIHNNKIDIYLFPNTVCEIKKYNQFFLYTGQLKILSKDYFDLKIYTKNCYISSDSANFLITNKNHKVEVFCQSGDLDFINLTNNLAVSVYETQKFIFYNNNIYQNIEFDLNKYLSIFDININSKNIFDTNSLFDTDNIIDTNFPDTNFSFEKNTNFVDTIPPKIKQIIFLHKIINIDTIYPCIIKLFDTDININKSYCYIFSDTINKKINFLKYDTYSILANISFDSSYKQKYYKITNFHLVDLNDNFYTSDTSIKFFLKNNIPKNIKIFLRNNNIILIWDDIKYITQYNIYLKQNDLYTKIGQSSSPFFLYNNVDFNKIYTFVITSYSEKLGESKYSVPKSIKQNINQ